MRIVGGFERLCTCRQCGTKFVAESEDVRCFTYDNLVPGATFQYDYRPDEVMADSRRQGRAYYTNCPKCQTEYLIDVHYAVPAIPPDVRADIDANRFDGHFIDRDLSASTPPWKR